MTKEEADKHLLRYLQEQELKTSYSKEDPNFTQLDDFELQPDEMLESDDGIKQAETLCQMIKPA